MKRAVSNLHRFARIFYICAHHLLAHAIGEQLKRFPMTRRLRLSHNYSGPQRLRMALQTIGGTFIKFGQVLALQSDVLPLAYCRELFSLLDRVPPFSFEEVERRFVQDLGRRPLEVFDSFDREPIATGSIGQVHVATLGQYKLAVKIRRPTVLEDFGSDIQLMMFTVRIITRLKLKMLYWMIAPTTEFVAWTRDELDYRLEAHYMDAVALNAQGNAQEQIPRVFWPYTTECILATEYFEAPTVLEYMRAREAHDESTLRRFETAGFDFNQYARNLIDNFLGDAFRYGIFHADLHPANLMIMPSSQVGYIDFGISGLLSSYSRSYLVAMTLAYTRGDLDGMCESFFHVSAMGEHSDRRAFRMRLETISREWYLRSAEHLKLRKSITAMMLDLLKLSRETGIWPQRDVVKYIRSAIALDGLIKSFAPGFDMGQHLETVCDSHLRWQSVRALLLPKTVLSLLEATAHVGTDGLPRAVTAMSGFTNGRKLDRKPGVGHRRGSVDVSPRYAAVGLFSAACLSLFHHNLAWRTNLQSAVAIVLILSVILAVREMILRNRPERSRPASTG
jgi:ubiquinone biosynthesis protein